MDGKTEFGNAIAGPRVPPEYGNPYAIPLPVARELIANFDASRPGIPPVGEARVALVVGPEVDLSSPTRSYGWYVAVPGE